MIWNKRNIIEKLEIKNKTILLLEPKTIKFGNEDEDRNLIAIDANNELLWEAELPSSPNDSYFKMTLKDSLLKAYSSNSFMVQLDVDTGRILTKQVFH